MSQTTFTTVEYYTFFLVLIVGIIIFGIRILIFLSDYFFVPEIRTLISKIIICIILIRLGGYLTPPVLYSIEPGGGGATETIDVFVLFYLFTPLIFSIIVFSFGITEVTLGIFTIAKGIFYIGLALISTAEYIYVEDADLAKLALGFTLSLAVFEAITSIIDGIKRIRRIIITKFFAMQKREKEKRIVNNKK